MLPRRRHFIVGHGAVSGNRVSELAMMDSAAGWKAIWFLADNLERDSFKNLIVITDRSGFGVIATRDAGVLLDKVDKLGYDRTPAAIVIDTSLIGGHGIAHARNDPAIIAEMSMSYIDALGLKDRVPVLFAVDGIDIGNARNNKVPVAQGGHHYISRDDGEAYEWFLKSLIISEPIIDPISFISVVELEQKVDDGHLISIIDPIYEEVIRRIIRNPRCFHEIPSRAWEELIAASYKKAGFDDVILTPRSGDLGRDIIAIKRGFGSIKFIEQVKAYKPSHLVTADEVRSLVGVLFSETDVSKAIFTTTSTFAPRLREDRLLRPLMPFRLELVDKAALVKRLSWNS